jgi:SAM-dependent methyltransferase
MTFVSRNGALAWWSALTIFLGAFLLFQVQPVVSKMILPWFGGGPAVWTTCLLFFQVLLLAGYAYAHALNRIRSRRIQLLLHLAVLAVAAVTLPITPGAQWKPLDAAHPTTRILALLAANVGLPYFVLSATSPLVQAWFSRALPERSPYRLYALSNVGSLGALLTYPFLIEPLCSTSEQDVLWSVAFVVFAFLCGGLAIVVYRAMGALADEPAATAAEASVVDPFEVMPTWMDRLGWLLLPALASLLLMAITNHLCQDVAVVPFFWVIPLSLYLLSFIICFDREAWYRRRIFSALTFCAVAGVCLILLEDDLEGLLKRHYREIDLFDFMDNLFIEAGVYLGLLFLVCMVCHGELVRAKPKARYLTEFYLMVAGGGALGGIFVGLICPQVFSSYVEMNIGLVLSFMLAIAVFWDSLWTTWLLNRTWRKCVAFAAAFLVLLVVVRAQFAAVSSSAKLSLRNFYGVLTLKEHYEDDPENQIRELLNGRILHGSQFVDETKRRLPTTYYCAASGVGLTLLNYRDLQPLRVGVVGLGTGTIASYGGVGDYYCFYEINPLVPMVARKYFTYLSDSGAQVEVELGDARLTLERQPPRGYDVIALDAFSSDAIPVHLLTKEAFELYLRHLKPEGVIVVHISNRHLDLKPVVGGIAAELNVPLVLIEDNQDEYVGEASSDWLLLTRNQQFLNGDAIREASETVEGTYTPVRLWTDEYSNLFQIMDSVPDWARSWIAAWSTVVKPSGRASVR